MSYILKMDFIGKFLSFTIMLLCCPLAIAEDEAMLFADTNTIVELKPSAIEQRPETKPALDFMYEMESLLGVSVPPRWFDQIEADSVLSDALMAGNLLIDGRINRIGVKGFANMEARNKASEAQPTIHLRELFMSMILFKWAFVSVGKQVLQWGRCRYWNPSDLINVEKRPFIDKVGYREGTYGAKVHIPYGTALNLYGFVDFNGNRRVRELSYTLKTEFTVKRTEFAFSTWYNEPSHTIYGFDFSTRMFDIDFKGELIVSGGSNKMKIQENEDNLHIIKPDENFTGAAAIGLSKTFDGRELNDLTTIMAEFYYNHDGYDKNPFQDETVYATKDFEDNSAAITKGGYLFMNDLYTPHALMKWYGAFSWYVRRVAVPELSFVTSAILNMQDPSAFHSTALTYRHGLFNHWVQLRVSGALGEKGSEYRTVMNDAVVEIRFGASF